ncbi:hypothetical protein P691DRAFT_685447, partial [Macrolepiota fuliginosa MF-IS2]
ILLIGSEYSPKIQTLVFAALATIHNFIWIHDHEEGHLPGSGNNVGHSQGANADDSWI